MKTILKEDLLIEESIQILSNRLKKSKDELTFTSSKETSSYLILKLAKKECEVFSILFLDSKHRMIDYKEMFFGEITNNTVNPRKVLKEVITQNATCVILAHSYLISDSESSQIDNRIIEELKNVLSSINVRVLDYFIISGTEAKSLAEQGLL